MQTVFRGETLRGLLLNVYGFAAMGQVMVVAAVAAFIGAGLMLILTVRGVWHLRRAAAGADVFPKLATCAQANAA